MAKKPLKRIIYSNYDLDEQYKDLAIENLEAYDIPATEDNIQSEINWFDAQIWQEVMNELNNFIPGKVIANGVTERWTGKRSGGQIYDSWSDFISEFSEDCDYFEFWDENGHLFVKCSHYDGTNVCEVKLVTEAGRDYYDSWNYDVASIRRCGDSEYNVIEKMFNSSKYSHIPNISHEIYGNKKREYEEVAA